MIYYFINGIIIAILISLVIIYKQKANIQITLNEKQILKNKNLEQAGLLLEEWNQRLEQEKAETEKQLSSTKIAVEAQENILKSLTTTVENLREAARGQADQEYQTRFEALAARYEQQENDYKQKYEQAIAILNKNLLIEQSKLKDIEAKQQAYIEAQKRALEIEAQKDFYRLVLSEYDINDIHLLRELQSKFTRKDVIDKMIWETYYRPAFDALVGRIFSTEKVCGIYKITSLINQQSYIGQSVDIKERFRQHIKAGLSYISTPNKLYQEIYKQGPENFTFEILEQVPREKLNERETYWIDFYKTKDIGLNITRGGA